MHRLVNKIQARVVALPTAPVDWLGNQACKRVRELSAPMLPSSSPSDFQSIFIFRSKWWYSYSYNTVARNQFIFPKRKWAIMPQQSQRWCMSPVALAAAGSTQLNSHHKLMLPFFSRDFFLRKRKELQRNLGSTVVVRTACSCIGKYNLIQVELSIQL